MCAFMRMTERFHQSHSIPGVPRLAHHRESRSARNVGLKRVGNICCDHVVIKSSKTLRLSLRLISVSLTWLEFCVGRCWKMLEDLSLICTMQACFIRDWPVANQDFSLPSRISLFVNLRLLPIGNESSVQNPSLIPFTGWVIGIPLLDYYNPRYTG